MKLALCSLLCCFVASAASLAEGDAALDSARQSYEELRYDEAAALLESALEHGALTEPEHEQALLLKGVVEVVRGDDEEARACFRELLEAKPDAALPSGLSPKITIVFDEVRAALQAEQAALAEPRPPEPVTEPAPEVAAPTAAAVPAAAAATSPTAQDDDEGISAVAVGVAAVAAVAAAVVVAGAGALFFFARGQPPESTLGTLQLP